MGQSDGMYPPSLPAALTPWQVLEAHKGQRRLEKCCEQLKTVHEIASSEPSDSSDYLGSRHAPGRLCQRFPHGTGSGWRVVGDEGAVRLDADYL